MKRKEEAKLGEESFDVPIVINEIDEHKSILLNQIFVLGGQYFVERVLVVRFICRISMEKAIIVKYGQYFRT